MSNPKFSLVLATVGRKDAVSIFLKSIASQSYAIDSIEIVLVDQNTDNSLDEIVFDYKKSLNINHVKSNTLGLSHNRNIGLELCSGEIICFPDDDCEYPSDILQNVEEIFSSGRVDIALGRIWDNKLAIPAIRLWPKMPVELNNFNFYRLTSSITLFTRNKSLRFDERFGLGSMYGSNEDVIYVYKHLLNGYIGLYDPKIVVYHDHQAIESLSIAKVGSYARGFGRFAREFFSINIFLLFFLSVSYQFLTALRALFFGNTAAARLHYASLKWRVLGFLRK